MTPRDQLYIGGRWVDPTTDDRLTVIDPATGTPAGTAPVASGGDMAMAVAAARHAFDHGPWPRMHPGERAAYLVELADQFDKRTSELAALITTQVGSPVAFTAQTTHPLDIYRYYARTQFGWRQARDQVLIMREPVGVVAAITPWNMPQKTIAMKLAPALHAGCTVIVKPAPQTPWDALLLAEVVDQVGFPAGVVNIVPTTNMIADQLVGSEGIDRIAFTGSTRTGRRVHMHAAHRHASVSLELGGKSPLLALPHTDPTAVAASLPADTFTLSGQICSAYTRLVVPADRRDEYLVAVAEVVEGLRVGPPTDPDTDIGPVISETARDRVTGYVQDAVGRGAQVVTGAVPHPGPGWYVTPTVLTDVPEDAPVLRDEVFGPVLVVQTYRDLDHGIDLANDTRYGLEAGVWTGDLDQVLPTAERLRVGTVRFNGQPAPISSPLGGVKQSGIGRELGPEGLHEYLETKALIT